MKLTLCAALLALAPCVYGAELPVTINGQAYTVTVDDGALWLLQRAPTAIYIERSPVPAAAVAGDGQVWIVAPDGSVWVDARKTAGNVKVSRLTVIGRTVYGKGLTDAKWWRFTGSGWTDASGDYVQLLEPPTPKVASSGR